jgi:hypothetical protein
MDKYTCGLVISLIGMFGTLLGLCAVVVAVEIKKRLFPYVEEAEPNGKGAR